MKQFLLIVLLCAFPLNAFSQLLVNADVIVTPTANSTAKGNAIIANKNERGDSPFNLWRSEIFATWSMSPMFTTYANFLFDAKMKSGDLKRNRPFRVDGLYLEGRPDSAFNFLVGKIPYLVGNFPARRFAGTNPLIGRPLMYSFKTPLTGGTIIDSLQLAANRDAFIPGIAPIEEAYWNDGIALLGDISGVRWSATGTRNSLSNPNVQRSLTNQLAGHLGTTLSDNLDIGVSAGKGGYLENVRTVRHEFIGADVRYEYWRYEFIGEAQKHTWDAPFITDKKLLAFSYYGEFRYQFSGSVHFLSRLEQLLFGDIKKKKGEISWGYDVTRLEAGLWYRFSTLLFKGVWQRTLVATLPESSRDVYAVQLVYRWDDIFKMKEE
ncbi:MAG: hypothetical protein KGZ58_02205 [Ignavibacteriales bacterium]|nr:hypothetical protein [Ignavibacteriales bacterium]